MSKIRYIIVSFAALVLLASCSSTKNTAGTRWYHAFNARYNIYFNGETAYDAALKTQQESYKENYAQTLLMFPVSALDKNKATTGGAFDKPIEKAVKAIKVHSIQAKPERKPGKHDPKYLEWMNRKEYNPFLHNAWMLMAKSQFHNGDFLQAESSFSYISRLYATQPEIAIDAKIWQARCYVEIGWFYEADDILSKIKKDDLSKKLRDWYDTVYADYLVQQKLYPEAVPYLKTAIRAEKNKLQKNREKYLLGQIYSTLGEKAAAYRIFGEVAGASVPYPLSFSAKIRQTEVYAGGDTTQITKLLRKMAKSSKNKDYLDQVYYALGNVYMAVPDTPRAIASYELGVEKSVQQGMEKALNQIQLGDLYFEMRKYIKAQPNYAEALPQLKKEDEAYPRVSKRSAILDELVVYAEAVELQDSLQRLSRMSEPERLAVVNKIIADLKKKEAEEKKKQEREGYLAQQEDTRSQLNANRLTAPKAPNAVLPPGSDDNTFYFYNPQMVAVGKNAFQQKWGRRKLEDDWRRRNKTNPVADLFADDAGGDLNLTNEEDIIDGTDKTVAAKDTAGLADDPYDPKFYLQQIPETEEEIAASDLIIADGLYHIAVIYKDELEDYNLALETFNRLDTRFPDNDNKLDAYYHTYLIYLRLENMEMANRYKLKIRADFPESEIAIAMADPDYEYNLRMMDVIQDSLYQDTYQAYLNGNVAKIRSNYQIAENKFGQSKLMPKFMFLNALSYVQTNDAEQFKAQLKTLIGKYPQADVSLLASEMMKGFQRGLVLAASGDNMLARGSLFNIRFGASGDVMAANDSIQFSAETQTPYALLIIYPQGTLDDNLLLYTVASFNFGNFIQSDFDLSKTNVGTINILQIKEFRSFPEILQYIQMIHGPEGYASGIEPTAVIVPISLENYAILMQGKSLEEYMQFFEEHFGKDNKSLVERWKASQKKEEEVEEAVVEEKSSEDLEAHDALNTLNGFKALNDTLEITNTAETPAPAPTVVEDLYDQANDIFDQGSQIADNINNTLNTIASDPVRGIGDLFKNLFKKKSSNAIDEYAKEQEQAEKERQKQLKKEKDAADKALREENRQKEKEQQELQKQQVAEEKAQLKAKENEKKRLLQEKEDARKQKEKARKEAQQLKEKQRKEKEKAREEARKQKEKERKEAQKLKEQERKAKAKKK